MRESVEWKLTHRLGNSKIPPRKRWRCRGCGQSPSYSNKVQSSMYSHACATRSLRCFPYRRQPCEEQVFCGWGCYSHQRTVPNKKNRAVHIVDLAFLDAHRSCLSIVQRLSADIPCKSRSEVRQKFSIHYLEKLCSSQLLQYLRSAYWRCSRFH